MFKKTNRIPPAREALVIDPQIQGALIRRVALYGICGLFYFSIIEFLDVALADPQRSWSEIGVAFLEQAVYWGPGMIVLLPIFAYDILRVSNRFAGPVVRLRKEMRDLTKGARLEPIEFRGEDYLHELADEYNALRDEVIKLREQATAVPKKEEGAPVRKGSLFGNRNKRKAAEEDLLETSGV
tara:strand:- start:212671 stop:213219 length:549 start_codon:yes stop_codon:yes gene_type:complete